MFENNFREPIKKWKKLKSAATLKIYIWLLVKYYH